LQREKERGYSTPQLANVYDKSINLKGLEGEARLIEKIAWLPDLIYTGGRFERGLALICDEQGRIAQFARETDDIGHVIRLKNRAMLPGLVNAHSHAFQRVIRGRTEYRTQNSENSFWTWREMMYAAAARLAPEDVYDSSRMAFLEMALSGITSVGEFHYLHHAPSGAPYYDPNLLSKEVVRAARDVGLRIALLRVAYARAGFRLELDERQKRFIESEPESFLRNVERLREEIKESEQQTAWVGVAPHSIRAVPLSYLREVIRHAARENLPVHMHIAEQPAEVSACMEEHGLAPVALLDSEGLLNDNFTAVHAIHISKEEARMLAQSNSSVCACPTTERNLGDGIFPADLFFAENARVALGTDSHAQIDLLEDARELEYHLRLKKLERNVLAEVGEDENSSRRSALAAKLFECASARGAESIGAWACGGLEPDRMADFFTVDLDDPSIAGAAIDDLLPAIVFSLARTAVREVVRGGKLIVEDGHHRAQSEIIQKFAALQRKLWG